MESNYCPLSKVRVSIFDEAEDKGRESTETINVRTEGECACVCVCV